MIRCEAFVDVGLPHAFFTREGGVSSGLYASLNCGFGSDDDPDAVAENRARTMARLGLPASALVTVHQIHSAVAVPVTTPWPREQAPRADALVTATPGIALGILTADCTPVLFCDPGAGVIGAAHAGWKGAIGGVLEATMTAMEAMGAARPRIQTAIGPCIAQPSYEVGPEFPAPFLAEDSGNARFFTPGARPDRHQFDLPGYVGHRLRRAGVGAVHRCDSDTVGDETRFFSYRRSVLRGEGDYGRQISVISLGAA